MPDGLDRRSFLKAAGGLGLVSLVPLSILERVAASTPGRGQPGYFLNAHQLDTLRAVTARFVPGPAEGEPDAGAREAGCAARPPPARCMISSPRSSRMTP